MRWLRKIADSDITRIRSNLTRLEELQTKVRQLGDFAIASQSGAFHMLESLLDEQIVKGRPKVLEHLLMAYKGENDQKVALDAPTRFQRLMFETEALIETEIKKEAKNLKELTGDDVRSKED